MRSPDTPPTSFPPDGPADPVGLQNFAVLLRRMNGEFNRIAHEFAQAHGLHLTDVQALIAILDAGAGPGGPGSGTAEPMTPGRLRRQLNLTSGAMTACLDRLERLGHVRRVRAADDRRVVHLHYAESARELARDYFQPLARSTDAARARFTRAELLTVVRFLGEMNTQLDALRS
ncbi:MarR family transcriptional regulator [Streptomyces solincola]|uniref:MarR family transcriptional regulator n=1 Tax=Streptomyces solincola TaxID=2100817 RepID=A0A2S9PTI2_9ACTN|nr:MarR family winged helix-turn-helix transcriptional regulator [Streptomyces solincola]PRH77726.1 MarR family transcriptional regulator [Streptomyces solincola]